MSLFSSVAAAPRDATFGIAESFRADQRPEKVDLSIGVYSDGQGHLPLLECVRRAEQQLAESPRPRGYLPMDGLPGYDEETRRLVFGPDSTALREGRVATVQSLGGTGALKIGADFLRAQGLAGRALISNPSWSNHRGVFGNAGFELGAYRYCDRSTPGVDMDGLLADLRAADAGTVVVLHACCHNPSGYDLTGEQWDQVIAVLRERRLTPFLDMAYQGFGNGLAEDRRAVERVVDAGLTCLVANSFSKNFSLYGERLGALSVVCQGRDEAERVLSQLKIVVRTNYSNPPTHGASVVATVLGSDELRAQWEDELAAMRARIKAMRQRLVEGLRAAGVQQDVGFMTRQLGMFSYSGLSTGQMQRLRDEFGVYGLDSGRLCVAGLNEDNIDYACRAIASVM